MAAFWACGGLSFRDPVEMVVERGIAGIELDEKTCVSAWQGGRELEERLGWEGGIDAGQWRSTWGEPPFGLR